MLTMETKPPTTVFEDLCGLAPSELFKPVDTTVPLPALLQPHWTIHLSSKKLRCLRVLAHAVPSAWNTEPPAPTIFIDDFFSWVNSLLKVYLLGEASPNPPTWNNTITPQHAPSSYSILLLFIGALLPGLLTYLLSVCLALLHQNVQHSEDRDLLCLFTAVSSTWGAVPGTQEALKKIFVERANDWMKVEWHKDRGGEKTKECHIKESREFLGFIFSFGHYPRPSVLTCLPPSACRGCRGRVSNLHVEYGTHYPDLVKM